MLAKKYYDLSKSEHKTVMWQRFLVWLDKRFDEQCEPNIQLSGSTMTKLWIVMLFFYTILAWTWMLIKCIIAEKRLDVSWHVSSFLKLYYTICKSPCKWELKGKNRFCTSPFLHNWYWHTELSVDHCGNKRWVRVSQILLSIWISTIKMDTLYLSILLRVVLYGFIRNIWRTYTRSMPTL